jgi:hypothetical protein
MAHTLTPEPSQHAAQFDNAHATRPTRTRLRLVWPLSNRSGPLVPYEEGTPHQLWGYIRTNPQWPWNMRVFEDGTVEQREGMTQDELKEAAFALLGGHQYDIEQGSWLHGVLVSAGYTFTEVLDGYGEFLYGTPAGMETETYGSPLPEVTDAAPAEARY